MRLAVGRFAWPLVAVAAGSLLLLVYARSRDLPPSPTPDPTPTRNQPALLAIPTAPPSPPVTSGAATAPDPARPVPTASPTAYPGSAATVASATARASAGLATSAPTTSPTTSPALSPTTSSTALPAAALLPANAARRFGVAGTMANVSAAVAAGLPVGAYLNWSLAANPARPAGADFWQMIRLDENGIRLTDWDEIAAVVAAQPGSIWIVGNEPDVIVQDNVTAERYAEIYHQVYHFIKRRDPGAYLAIAGVAQPTPLRLAYLDRVLEHYQASYGEPMPIDLWTVHAFILREEAGSWGVGIPPGFNQTEGRLYEVADHGDLTIWQQNLVDFRAWMARRGYANRPLAVTEYGIIMPPDYGYPTETAARFMIDTLDFMGRAAGETGYPADGGRLVQWWFWYSVYDSEYHAPNLYDRASRDLTALGRVYAAYPRD